MDELNCLSTQLAARKAEVAELQSQLAKQLRENDRLSDALEASEASLTEAESERDSRYTLGQLGEELLDLLEEVECRCCHKRFRSHPSVRYCTWDCEFGVTPPVKFEEYYRNLHPKKEAV